MSPKKAPRAGQSVGFHLFPRISKESTIGDPETIIWSSIRHLSSRYVAEAVAFDAHGITRKRDREAAARNLKLYIKQASSFYEAAKAAKPNTAPLIYYYSFLNLAKALCELRQPRFHERPECYRHGISWWPNPRRLVDPAKETVLITTRGVWHALWEALTKERLVAANPTRIRIKYLFSYCPEVSVEYRRAMYDLIRLMDVENPDILSDGSNAWIRFSVKREELRGFHVSAPSLLKQIRTGRSGYIEVQSSDKRVRTFESAVPIALTKWQYPSAALHGDVLGLNAFTHLTGEGKLQYFFPIQNNLPLRLPQIMVAYTLLFWFGSLVRYDPHSVDALMDSEWWTLMDGLMSQSRLWLLELFEWAMYQAETTLCLAR